MAEIMNDFERLGRRIKELRLSMNWSQEECAWQCGLSKSHYCEIERGNTNPRFEVLYQLADTFSIQLHELLNFNEENEVIILRKNERKALLRIAEQLIQIANGISEE